MINVEPLFDTVIDLKEHNLLPSEPFYVFLKTYLDMMVFTKDDILINGISVMTGGLVLGLSTIQINIKHIQ